jgi:hypothetical protein
VPANSGHTKLVEGFFMNCHPASEERMMGTTMTMLTICAALGALLSVSSAIALDSDRVPMQHNPYAVFVHHEQVREKAMKEIQKIKAEMDAIPGTSDMELAGLERLRCRYEKLSHLLLSADLKHQELNEEKQGVPKTGASTRQELSELKRRVRDLEHELRLMKLGC